MNIQVIGGGMDVVRGQKFNLVYKGAVEETTERSGRSKIFAIGAALVAVALMTGSLAAGAQDFEQEATTPAAAVAQPQYSSITSTNNVIQATRVPVSYNGAIRYVDLTLTLTPEVNTAGVVTMTATAATPASPAVLVNNFKAGTYVSPSTVYGGTTYIVVSGPSPLSGGGTGWTITTSSSTSSKSTPQTYPSTATWYVESIANNPLAARIKAAGITSTAYSYGEGDSGSQWDNNALLGFSQVGNSLEISNFTYAYTDKSTPQDTVTFTLVP